MKSAVVLLLAALSSMASFAQGTPEEKNAGSGKEAKIVVSGKPAEPVSPQTPPPDSTTQGTVTVRGQKIAYTAVAGTITVGGTDSYDAMLGLDGKLLPDTGTNPPDPQKPEDAPATARIFYTAYFRQGAEAKNRPVMFFYNGGPGSATVWLHMGSFGPRRVVVPDTEHKEGAPYQVVENEQSLLDVTDLVFIDAPGTGYSRIMGKDAEKAFWGSDPDAHAFARFIRRFMTKYDRWNSPKYLFGESYGTPRSAMLSAILAQGDVDLNGVVLLSAILCWDNSIDGPNWNPSVDQAYALGLPTFAATAFYHHKLPTQPPALQPFLQEVEGYALNEYMPALLQGSLLPPARKQAIAEKLHGYTGLPVDYLLKANLRVTGAEFEKELQDPEGLTTGRLDSRFEGPNMERMSSDAMWDPQSNAISSAWVAAFNNYVHTELKYGRNQTYKEGLDAASGFTWDYRHQAPNGPKISDQSQGTNMLPDLADTMKFNPKLQVFLAGGYFDLATPYFEGQFEMHHLPMPDKLQSNISYHYYESGHMVYVNPSVLGKFHDDVAAFVRRTEAGE